jgi:hypothetical protein
MFDRDRARPLASLAAASIAAASLAGSAGATFTAAGGWGTVRSTTLSSRGLAILASRPWISKRYAGRSGESVDVSVSPAYASEPGASQRWGSFFSALIHGPELASLEAYVAPLAEVEAICGADALGCYGTNHLVTMGEANHGVSAESVATHEYGHHIAANRSNAPWVALDWGPKWWASSVEVCSRTRAGTAFPGDEGLNYSFNPGEAFAESYRVLIEEADSGVASGWAIVDPSFRPNPDALAAIRRDVLEPWVGPRTETIHGKFLRGSRTWTRQVRTPLDGDLHLRLTTTGGGAADVTLLSGDARTVLAKSSWDPSGSRSIEYRLCGMRSLRVRVNSGAAPARFALRVTVP